MTTARLGSADSVARPQGRGKLTALLAGAMMMLTACGDSSTDVASQATLVVRNQSAEAIQMVQIAQCTDEFWGANRLGPDQTLAPGSSRGFTVEPGCWDLRLSTVTRSDEWFDIELQAGGTIELALTATASPGTDQASAGPVNARNRHE